MAVAIVHPPRWRWGTRDSYAGVGPSASTFSLPASLCLHRASRATEVANQEDPTGPRPRGVGSTDQEGGRLANLPPARRAGLRALLAGLDLSEQSVLLVVWAGGEEEGSGRPGCGVVTEPERPQAVDGERLTICSSQGAPVREGPVRASRVGVDLPVAEVAHEEVAAKPAEARRRERQPPRRVQLTTAGDAPEEGAARVEPVDEAQALPGDLVLCLGILLGVGQEDLSTDVLDSERREPVGDSRIDEGAWVGHQVEATVEHVNAGVVKVGGVDESRGTRVARTVAHDEVRAAVEDKSCRGALDLDHERNGVPVARVQG